GRGAGRGAERARAVLGAVVGPRVLELVRRDAAAARGDPREPRRVEVRRADQLHLAGRSQVVEPVHRFHVARHAIVPPVELYEVQALLAQARQRRVDDLLHVPALEPRQRFEIGHELGRDAQPARVLGMAAANLADQLLHADVVIRAVEEGNAGLDEAARGVERRLARVGRAVPLGELPVALGDARDNEPRSQCHELERHGCRPMLPCPTMTGRPLRPPRIELAPRLDIPRVLTGLWQIARMERDGKPLDPDAAAFALGEYAEAGFDAFDMADHYGSAEILVGRYLATAGPGRATAFTKWCPLPGPMTSQVV